MITRSPLLCLRTGRPLWLTRVVFLGTGYSRRGGGPCGRPWWESVCWLPSWTLLGEADIEKCIRGDGNWSAGSALDPHHGRPQGPPPRPPLPPLQNPSSTKKNYPCKDLCGRLSLGLALR